LPVDRVSACVTATATITDTTAKPAVANLITFGYVIPSGFQCLLYDLPGLVGP